MDFGISCSRLDDVELIPLAEHLGYDFCWVTDSPMLRSNPFVMLTLAAQRTTTLRLGMGVAVPGLRVAPELAGAIATVNRLAPGRTFLGIGTGNTAMRTLGRKPARIAEFAAYIEEVQGLLRGDEIQHAHDGTTSAVRLQNLDQGYLDVSPAIPVHIGGFGPRAQRLAGELGDGLITGIPRGGAVDAALANVRAGAARRGRTLDGFYTSALVNMLLLEPGETLASERVIAECGPGIMANVHYLVDLHAGTDRDPPAYVQGIWEEYLAFHRTRDVRHSHQELHASHYNYLDPEEARFVTPDLIRAFSLAGQPEEILDQLSALEAQGLDGVCFILPADRREQTYTRFAREVIARA